MTMIMVYMMVQYTRYGIWYHICIIYGTRWVQNKNAANGRAFWLVKSSTAQCDTRHTAHVRTSRLIYMYCTGYWGCELVDFTSDSRGLRWTRRRRQNKTTFWGLPCVKIYWRILARSILFVPRVTLFIPEGKNNIKNVFCQVMWKLYRCFYEGKANSRQRQLTGTKLVVCQFSLYSSLSG